MRALCTAATGDTHLQLLDLAEPSFKRYADRWNLDLIVERDFDCGRPPSWFKIKLLQELLFQRGYETVTWVDADAIFLRDGANVIHTPTLTRSPVLWMVKHGTAGITHKLPNCGVMVACRSPQLYDFLNEVWDQTQFIDHPWWEQAAILHLLGYSIDPPGGLAHPGPRTPWSGWVGELPLEYNSMPLHETHPDPIIEHYSGMRFAERLERMARAAQSPVPA